MSTAEIIAELAHLSADDLAAVRAWLDRHAAEQSASPAHRSAPPRLRSPRLANPDQAKAFAKQVITPDHDAGI